MKSCSNLLVCLFVLAWLGACGGSSGGSVAVGTIDGGAVTIENSDGGGIDATNSYLENDSAIAINFSIAMSSSTISASTLTLTDANGASVSGTVSAMADSDGISDNEYKFKSDSPLDLAAVYEFIISGGANGVTGADGEILLSDLTYTFTTTCGVADIFSDPLTLEASSGCWSFDDELGIGDVDLHDFVSLVDGKLVVSIDSGEGTGAKYLEMYKQDAGDYTYTMKVDSIEFTPDPLAQHSCGLQHYDRDGDPLGLRVYLYGGYTEQKFTIISMTAGYAENVLVDVYPSDFPVYLRIAQSGTSLMSYYSLDGINYELMNTVEGISANEAYVGFVVRKESSTPYIVTVDSILRE